MEFTRQQGLAMSVGIVVFLFAIGTMFEVMYPNMPPIDTHLALLIMVIPSLVIVEIRRRSA